MFEYLNTDVWHRGNGRRIRDRCVLAVFAACLSKTAALTLPQKYSYMENRTLVLQQSQHTHFTDVFPFNQVTYVRRVNLTSLMFLLWCPHLWYGLLGLGRLVSVKKNLPSEAPGHLWCPDSDLSSLSTIRGPKITSLNWMNTNWFWPVLVSLGPVLSGY